MDRIDLVELRELLVTWLNSSSDTERKAIAELLEQCSSDREILGLDGKQLEVIYDLGHDCAFYSENESHLREDSSLLDYKAFKLRVEKALERITNE